MEDDQDSALWQAHRLQLQAAAVGFDWGDVGAVYAKLEEEMAELGEALQQGELSHSREELGDVLFVCVALARHLGGDPESLMAAANRKFESRFGALEVWLRQRGLAKETASMTEMEAGWQAIKSQEQGCS